MSVYSVWMVVVGVFLILCGLIGWAAAGFSASAKSAIISGAASGTILVVLGLVATGGADARRLGIYLGLAFAVIFTIAFVWRAVMSWQAVAAGAPRLYAAVLISLMALASLATIGVLVWQWPHVRREA